MDREIPKEELTRCRRRRIAVAAAIITAAVVGIAILFSSLSSSISRTDIILSEATIGTIETSINSSGTVVPAFEEIITSPISTRIVEVYCNAGDSVGVGTPLLRLDLQSAEAEMRKLVDQMRMKRVELDKQDTNSRTSLSNLEMQIKVKEMEVNRLEVELANERYLDSLGSGTGDRVREVELACLTGQLALEQMRRQLDGERRIALADRRVKELDINIFSGNISEMKRTLDDARVCAPRGGTLTYINNQIGQKVAEGERIAILSDLSHFRIKGQVADSYADKICEGARAVIKTGKDKFEGTVMNVEPQSQEGMITFYVRIDSEYNSRLRSGLKTDVYVMHDVMDDVVRIANGPYYQGPGEYRLFVLTADGSSIKKRIVSLGDCNYEYVEVRSGIEPGEQIVVSDMSDYKTNNVLKIK